MYTHNITEMTEVVAKALGLDCAPEKMDTIYHTLQSYWRDKIAVSWSIEDVQERSLEMWDEPLSDDEAREVLGELKCKHNADIGINWSVIEDSIIHNRKRRIR